MWPTNILETIPEKRIEINTVLELHRRQLLLSTTTNHTEAS